MGHSAGLLPTVPLVPLKRIPNAGSRRAKVSTAQRCPPLPGPWGQLAAWEVDGSSLLGLLSRSLPATSSNFSLGGDVPTESKSRDENV